MRAVVQRVSAAKVMVDGETVGAVDHGLCVFVGVERGDDEAAARQLVDKVVGLRIFEDDAGKMNRSLLDTGGGLLAVSQFTLLGDVRKGKRPSFSDAMEPEAARALFECFCELAREQAVRVETGRFRAHMTVQIVNEGPVTILIDTKKAF